MCRMACLSDPNPRLRMAHAPEEQEFHIICLLDLTQPPRSQPGTHTPETTVWSSQLPIGIRDGETVRSSQTTPTTPPSPSPPLPAPSQRTKQKNRKEQKEENKTKSPTTIPAPAHPRRRRRQRPTPPLMTPSAPGAGSILGRDKRNLPRRRRRRRRQDFPRSFPERGE